MRRFFVDPAAVGSQYITIDGEDVKHIKRVLRLKPGDQIEISDSDQWEYRCEISSISNDTVDARILDKQTFAREPKINLALFQGVPKGNKMEQIVQKSTELGVRDITPVFMERSIVADHGKYNRKILRYNAIAREAAKQCRRGVVPVVHEALHSDDILNVMSEYDLVLLPYENEKDVSLKQALRSLNEKPGSVALIIGPEGGFSEDEARRLIFGGALSVSLGKTIMRTETAGPAAIAMCYYEIEMSD